MAYMDLLHLLLPFLRDPRPATPAEAEPTEEERPIDDTTPSLNMPAGKGIFVQSVEMATPKGTPAAVAARAQDLGLSWVALLSIWQHSDRDRIYNMVPETIVACAKVNIGVYLWGWPQYGASRIDRFVMHMSQQFEQNAVDGIIMNAEAPLYGKPGPATSLCTEIRGRLPDASIGLSSYGNPTLHPRFPWAPFAKVCDYGAPQIYDSDHNLGPKYPQQCFAGWRKVGFSRAGKEILVPTWGASKAHTAAQMQDIIQRTPRAPASCWWDMNWLRTSTARADVVRKMNWFLNS